jgi:hypothetical protein
LNTVVCRRQGRKYQIAYTVTLQARPKIEPEVEGAVKRGDLLVPFRAECDQALPEVAKWWVAKLFPENPGAAAAIEHSDDSCQIEVVRLEPAQGG